MYKLILNLFAEVQVTTQPSLSAEMKTFYDMRLIDEASPMLVHEQFGQKRPIPQGGGKSIEFRKFSPLPKALVPLTEGVTPNGNSLEVTKMTATVEQFGDFIVQSDVLELTAIDNTILEATKLLGKQAGLTMDTIVRNIMNSGTNVSYAPKISGSTETEVTSRKDLDKTAKLTVDVVQRIVAKLRAQNAPTINGDYVAIIHPYVAYDLMRDPEWIDAHKYSTPENIYTGEIGKIGGVRFVQSTEAKIFAPKIKGKVKTAVSSAGTSITVEGNLPTMTGVSVPCYLGGNINTITAIAEASDGVYTVTLGTAATAAVGDILVDREGTADGLAVFSCLFLGDGAYGVTEVTGGGLQTIIKQKGSAGTADPLDQRSSVGWKGLKTAKILVDNYLVRCEVCSRYSDTASAN